MEGGWASPFQIALGYARFYPPHITAEIFPAGTIRKRTGIRYKNRDIKKVSKPFAFTMRESPCFLARFRFQTAWMDEWFVCPLHADHNAFGFTGVSSAISAFIRGEQAIARG